MMSFCLYGIHLDSLIIFQTWDEKILWDLISDKERKKALSVLKLFLTDTQKRHYKHSKKVLFFDLC